MGREVPVSAEEYGADAAAAADETPAILEEVPAFAEDDGADAAAAVAVAIQATATSEEVPVAAVGDGADAAAAVAVAAAAAAADKTPATSEEVLKLQDARAQGEVARTRGSGGGNVSRARF